MGPERFFLDCRLHCGRREASALEMVEQSARSGVGQMFAPELRSTKVSPSALQSRDYGSTNNRIRGMRYVERDLIGSEVTDGRRGPFGSRRNSATQKAGREGKKKKKKLCGQSRFFGAAHEYCTEVAIGLGRKGDVASSIGG